MKKLCAFMILALASLAASAEKADASKQAILDANEVVADNVKQTMIMSGNVIITKGTLLLKAEKALLKETPDEYMEVTLNAGAGKMATFRQKRDGGPDLWIEGEAQRIEYDERTSKVKLFGAAKIRQLEGGRMTNDIQGEYISYDSMREVFDARNDAGGTNKAGGGRVRMILAPKKPRPSASDAATPPAPGTTPPGTP